MVSGKFFICFSFKVKGWCCISEMNCCYILLVEITEFFYTLCRPSRTNYHQTGSQRVKSPGMSYFQFFNPEPATDHYPDLIHKVEGCPVKRLVKKKNLSFFEEIFLFLIHINL